MLMILSYTHMLELDTAFHSLLTALRHLKFYFIIIIVVVVMMIMMMMIIIIIDSHTSLFPGSSFFDS